MTTGRFVLTLLLCACVYSANVITFDEFIAKFKKPYQAGTEEYKQKKLIFDENVKQLIAQNCDVCGVTKFFDISKSDFASSTFYIT